MSYLLENSIAGSQEVDSLGHIKGPFSHMRKVLWSVGALCLPDPHHGFLGDIEGERKARELVEKLETKKKFTRLLEQTSPETRMAA